MSYQIFAQVYDQVMDDQLYSKWQNYLALALPNRELSILELACGTGALAVQLKKAGYDVTGLDLSGNMLTLAQDRALASGIDLPLLQGDMLDLTGIGSFDAVTCFSDSLCYMPDSDALKKVFEQVYQVLHSDGLFLFDVHSLYQMDDVFPGYMYNETQEDFSFLWRSYQGQAPHSIEHELTFFVYDDVIKGYQKFEELHEERTYSMATYKRLLQEVGFKNIRITAEFGEQEVTDTSTRWFFTCEK